MENRQLASLSKCNATGKTRYYDQNEAKEAMLRIKAKKNVYDNITKKRLKRRQGKPDQCRVYYCKLCRGYHLTSIAALTLPKTIEKTFMQRVRNTNGLVLSEEEALAWKKDSIPFPETQTPNLCTGID